MDMETGKEEAEAEGGEGGRGEDVGNWYGSGS